MSLTKPFNVMSDAVTVEAKSLFMLLSKLSAF